MLNSIYVLCPYMVFGGIQHSGTGKPDPKTIYGQRPYMGFNTVGQENQTGKPDPKTIYGQRPYMGFNTVGQGNLPKDHRIQHSWDRETGPKDHIWAKTIYGIQHSGTGKPDPKTIGFNTVGTGKPDPKTIYGQRPYMGFNTVGQENQTQKTIGFNTVGRKTRPKDHIWAKTIYGIQRSGTCKETRPKDHRIQHSWDRETKSKDHIWAKTIYGIQHSGAGNPDPKTIGFNTVGTYMGLKPDPKTIYGIQHSWDRETGPKDHI